MLAFLLSWPSWAAVTELAWPAELSVFPVSPPMESNCQPSQCGHYEAGHASRHCGGSIKAPSPFILCTGQVVHWLLFRSTAFASQSATADLYFLLRLLSLWYCELGERKCEDQGSLLEQTGSQVPQPFLSWWQEWERNASSERLAFLCLITDARGSRSAFCFTSFKLT